MERLALRLNAAKSILLQFEQAILMAPSVITRDVTLLRFQLTTEATWKLAQHYLRDKEGLDIHSPKGSVRASMQQGLISETQTKSLLEIMDDRNLIVHTYNEPLSEQLYKKMQNYYELLKFWINAIENSM